MKMEQNVVVEIKMEKDVAAKVEVGLNVVANQEVAGCSEHGGGAASFDKRAPPDPFSDTSWRPAMARAPLDTQTGHDDRKAVPTHFAFRLDPQFPTTKARLKEDEQNSGMGLSSLPPRRDVRRLSKQSGF